MSEPELASESKLSIDVARVKLYAVRGPALVAAIVAVDAMPPKSFEGENCFESIIPLGTATKFDRPEMLIPEVNPWKEIGPTK